MNQQTTESLIRALNSIAHSITPLDASPVSVGHNKQVGSLTEAVMYLTSGLHDIASAIREHTSVIDNRIE